MIKGARAVNESRYATYYHKTMTYFPQKKQFVKCSSHQQADPFSQNLFSLRYFQGTAKARELQCSFKLMTNDAEVHGQEFELILITVALRVLVKGNDYSHCGNGISCSLVFLSKYQTFWK